LIMATLSLSSLLVAFSYYCYIRNKVSKRSKLQQSMFFSSLFSFYIIVALFACCGGDRHECLQYMWWQPLSKISSFLVGGVEGKYHEEIVALLSTSYFKLECRLLVVSINRFFFKKNFKIYNIAASNPFQKLYCPSLMHYKFQVYSLLPT